MSNTVRSGRHKQTRFSFSFSLPSRTFYRYTFLNINQKVLWNIFHQTFTALEKGCKCPPGHVILSLHLVRSDACQNKRRIVSEDTVPSTLWAMMCSKHVLLSSQLDATASQLNSNDAFVLATPGDSFLWVGAGASDGEKHGAQQLCDILGVSASEMSEGGESSKEEGRRAVSRCSFCFPKARLSSRCLSRVCVWIKRWSSCWKTAASVWG